MCQGISNFKAFFLFKRKKPIELSFQHVPLKTSKAIFQFRTSKFKFVFIPKMQIQFIIRIALEKTYWTNFFFTFNFQIFFWVMWIPQKCFLFAYFLSILDYLLQANLSLLSSFVFSWSSRKWLLLFYNSKRQCNKHYITYTFHRNKGYRWQRDFFPDRENFDSESSEIQNFDSESSEIQNFWHSTHTKKKFSDTVQNKKIAGSTKIKGKAKRSLGALRWWERGVRVVWDWTS